MPSHPQSSIAKRRPLAKATSGAACHAKPLNNAKIKKRPQAHSYTLLRNTAAALQRTPPHDVISRRHCCGACATLPRLPQQASIAAATLNCSYATTCVYPNTKQAPQHYPKCCGTSRQHTVNSFC
jgi:hypothetical protein